MCVQDFKGLQLTILFYSHLNYFNRRWVCKLLFVVAFILYWFRRLVGSAGGSVPYPTSPRRDSLLWEMAYRHPSQVSLGAVYLFCFADVHIAIILTCFVDFLCINSIESCAYFNDGFRSSTRILNWTRICSRHWKCFWRSMFVKAGLSWRPSASRRTYPSRYFATLLNSHTPSLQDLMHQYHVN